MNPLLAGPIRLETERLVIRELVEDDWRAHRALDSDPQVVRYQSNDTLDETGTQEYVRKSIAAAQALPRSVYDLAVTLRGSTELFGRVGMSIARPEHRDAMIWFAARRDTWGKGYMTEAARALFDFAFGPLGLHRLWGDTDPRNVGSARIMEKLNMRREAHFRENWWLKGEWCDSWVYAILEQEWRAPKART
jgi:[ribosomal protein S5]-alanine N-acetyltransferase